MSWWRLSIRFPIELEESLLWKLEEFSINRIAFQASPDSLSDPILFVWLPEIDWGTSERDALTKALNDLSKPFLRDLGNPIWDRIEDEDWSQTWKAHWKPDPVGESLLILPAWMKVPISYSERIVLRIDPGCAFGTGSHPTTRLCLEALERTSLSGSKIADLGCGSGILGLAALLLGAEKVFAVDIDFLAVQATMRNFQMNGFQDDLKVALGSIEILESDLKGGKVDFLLCNILAPVIESCAPKFDNILKEGGIALLSGLLVGQSADLKKTFRGIGWEVLSQQSQGSWGLLEVRKC